MPGSVHAQQSPPDESRRARLRGVVDEVLRCRTAGQVVCDDEIIAEHPELMPELAEDLRALALIAAARRSADEPSPSMPDGQAGATPSDLPTADVHRLSNLDVRDNGFDSLSGSIEGYSIVREIHRGGQGIVYQAIQKATRRKVAIKVMREGPFAGERDRARFEREVQILAAMNHPSIVTVHDCGLAAGNYYFVMDYISGQPLDVYMASGKRSIEETLRLFIKIAGAVHAAHLKGVIHRDLKPGNIRIDAQGQPHILDFGLAKMATGDITGESQPQVMTVTGQFVGSLPWASPEQAEGLPGKIDIRTDVYSLGVILYQMLTGKFPYGVVGNMREVLEQIISAEPVSPRTIRKEIDDEVETIVLKCLAKEPGRRYQSANELARDVEHYLAGDPIEAKRDSSWYVLRKSLRRYRLAAGVGSAFLCVILVALIVSIAFWRKAVLARGDAENERDKSALALVQKEKALADAEQARQNEARHRDRAERAYVEAEDAREEAEHRTSEARLSADGLEVLLQTQGDFTAAERHFHRVLARVREQEHEPHPHAATALHNLAGVLRAQGRYAEAEQRYAESLALRRRLFGGQSPLVAQSLSSLAAVLRGQHRYTEAEKHYREALSIPLPPGPMAHRHRTALQIELARTLLGLRRFADGQEQLMAAHRASQGPQGPPPDLVLKTAEGFVDLYQAWAAAEPGKGYESRAAEWRTHREQARAAMERLGPDTEERDGARP